MVIIWIIIYCRQNHIMQSQYYEKKMKTGVSPVLWLQSFNKVIVYLKNNLDNAWHIEKIKKLALPAEEDVFTEHCVNNTTVAGFPSKTEPTNLHLYLYLYLHL